ncbi:hypothetical protein OIU74_012836 [Salix koriyanagi]|uniref:Uncharacterized protein n=2 Tax=Salix TaxID=40685 RepID=A0A9Q0Q814_9ROSI|nr:hypothetical protein OIU74_012836 [Salix koriyanagi]
MANSSGLFSPSVPSLRGKIKPSMGVIGSGIWSPQRISKRVVCSGTIEGSEKISSSQSRLPRSVFWLLNHFYLESIGKWVFNASGF